MTTQSFSDLYKQVETGATGIPTSTYDVTVEDVRANVNDTKRVLFLDLRVLDGPAAGKTASVTLNFPNEDAKQGAFFHFRRKIAGFNGPDLKAAFELADRAPTPETALETIADAIKGKSVTANIKLVTEGAYKGNNELVETKALQGAVPTEQYTAPEAETVDSNAKGAEVPF